MTNLETMAATVQGQHDALMVAQGLPTYDRLKRERDALAEALKAAIPFIGYEGAGDQRAKENAYIALEKVRK